MSLAKAFSVFHDCMDLYLFLGIYCIFFVIFLFSLIIWILLLIRMFPHFPSYVGMHPQF